AAAQIPAQQRRTVGATRTRTCAARERLASAEHTEAPPWFKCADGRDVCHGRQRVVTRYRQPPGTIFTLSTPITRIGRSPSDFTFVFCSLPSSVLVFVSVTTLPSLLSPALPLISTRWPTCFCRSSLLPTSR